jgi:hypothetical protein
VFVFPPSSGNKSSESGAPNVYPIGTMAKVVQLNRATGKDAFRFSILVEGVSRISLTQFTQVCCLFQSITSCAPF